MALFGLVFVVLLSRSLCLILPLTKPGGEVDLTSVINHIALIEQRLDNVEAGEKSCAVDIVTLKAQLKSTTDELTSVKSNSLAESKTFASEIAVLKAQLTSVTAENKANAAEVTALKTRLNWTENELTTMKSNVLTARVSFVVEASSDATLEKHEILKLGRVIENEGNGYTVDSGIFTAPIGGTYLVMAQVLFSIKDTYMFLTLKKNGADVAAGYGETSMHIYRSVATINVFVNLQRGDRLWFTNDYGNATISGSFGLYSRVGALLVREA